MRQTVELFSGHSKRFSSVASALGFATFTVDADPGASPSLIADVRTVGPEKLPAMPLVVWAEPPHSPTFADRDCWDKDGSFHPSTPEAEEAIALIRSTIGLMAALKPQWWFLAHPRSLLRSMPTFAGFNRGYPSRNRHTIRHDEFGGRTSAETDVWTNPYWWIPRQG